jgi:hypothetical protein
MVIASGALRREAIWRRMSGWIEIASSPPSRACPTWVFFVLISGKPEISGSSQ